MPFSRGSSQPRDQTLPLKGGKFINTEPPGKPKYMPTLLQIHFLFRLLLDHLFLFLIFLFALDTWTWMSLLKSIFPYPLIP